MGIFNIEKFEIENKKRNLESKSSGVVSSTKYFPVFEVDGKEMIFKPLSKTKPYSTPLFAYSEVYWSYLLKKYIDKKNPQYTLATCKNLSQEQPKYYEKGTIVENILQDGEELVNLLELFRKYPDSLVDINDYINYCEVQYDYENILKSTFFTERKDLGEQLAEQILCSILRRDDNYHYENVSLIKKDNKFERVAPIIDTEFSEMFMHIDEPNYHTSKFSSYDSGMSPVFKYKEGLSYEENYMNFINKAQNGSIFDKYGYFHTGNLRKNIKCIVELYPDVARRFISKLELMRKEVEKLSIDFDDNYLGEFSSEEWEANSLLLKEGYSKEDEKYKFAYEKAKKTMIRLNKDQFNKQLKREVLWSIDKLTYILKIFLDINDNKKIDIKNYEETSLYPSKRELSEEELEYLTNFLDQQKNQK